MECQIVIFAVFPGSGLFGKKRATWVLGFELVETSRLWARKVAEIDPKWVEEVVPHLCRSRYHSPYWNEQQGAVYGKEEVMLGGLTIMGRSPRVLWAGESESGARGLCQGKR